MSTADNSSCQTSGCSIKGRPYPGPGPGASSPRDPSGTRKRVPGRMVPLLGVRPFSIQQWKETVLKQLNFYSIEEHFFFWYVNTHFLCVFFDSNRNVDDRSKEDDRQSNTMIPHC